MIRREKATPSDVSPCVDSRQTTVVKVSDPFIKEKRDLSRSVQGGVVVVPTRHWCSFSREEVDIQLSV